METEIKIINGVEVKVNWTLTTKQEDLMLENEEVFDDEFLDHEEQAEKQAEYNDFMFDVMRDLEMEKQYENGI